MDPVGFLVTLLTFNAGLLSVAGIDVVPRVAERAAQQAVVLETWADNHPEGILVLQEMWSPAHSSPLAKKLEARGWSVWVPPQRAGWGATSGLMMAVGPRYRVIDRGFEGFTQKLGWESLSAKGTAWLKLESLDGGDKLVVLDTHLAAVDTVEGRLVDTRQLPLYRSQVNQVLNLARRTAGEGALWLLAGDFNAGELAAAEAWALWGSDAGTDLERTPPLVTWDSANPLVRDGLFPNAGTADLDHALWPATAGVTLLSARRPFDGVPPLSDHEALEVSLTAPLRGIKLSGE